MLRTAAIVAAGLACSVGGFLIGSKSSSARGEDDKSSESNGKQVVTAVLRGPKTKTVHFIRHAEGTHNKAAREEGRVAYTRLEHMDARLTEEGRAQCRALKAQGHGLEKEVQLVVVSPLTRAIQTALLTIERVPGVPWIALECTRERAGSHFCDKRRTVSELKEEFPMIDWGCMEDEQDVYWDCLGEDREPDETLARRARELFAWLSKRPEDNICVVTHSAFLSSLFNLAVQCGPGLSRWFENCELRTALLEL